MILSIIAAIGKYNELGKNNELLWSLPADMKHFKETTTGHTIIMGRKTFESFPNGALPNRRNIVVTRDIDYYRDGIETAHSLEEALQMAALEQGKYFDEVDEEIEVFIIGGGELYKQSIDRANRLYITHVDASADADTFFPTIDSTWQKISEEKHESDEKNLISYSFVKYKK